MSSKEQYLSAALNRSMTNINEYYERELLTQPAMRFAEEFMALNEIPEMILRVSSTGDTSVGEAFLIATNERLFYSGGTGKGMLQSAKPDCREYAYRGIAKIQFEQGNAFKSSSLTFHVPTKAAKGNITKVTFKTFNIKEDIQRFVEYVRKKMTTVNRSIGAADSQPAPDDQDFVEKLERLGSLKNQGLITEDEFTAAKKKLLDSQQDSKS